MKPRYRIHYDRWHRRFDEWVTGDRLTPLSNDKIPARAGVHASPAPTSAPGSTSAKTSRGDRANTPQMVDRPQARATPASSGKGRAAEKAPEAPAPPKLPAAEPPAKSSEHATPQSAATYAAVDDAENGLDDETLKLARALELGLRRETRRSWNASISVATRRVRFFFIYFFFITFPFHLHRCPSSLLLYI
jgi:hypothetical protein